MNAKIQNYSLNILGEPNLFYDLEILEAKKSTKTFTKKIFHFTNTLQYL
jgi:hypothetical protein